ncbi:MAG: hypothetical protein C4541_11290 [Candidatus Auribacter fodinae]|jgi:hypothetical protein|uniref:Fibronectin type-III domain-containing protein n=1 Tax=Candidatus Auribacter fodinae TaxID=2093366 RepID=A0A3A4QVU0_9BACT|nr:MAG: hypothetical protein C4541_11290 [Candidatus Auribacter fodinae]
MKKRFVLLLIILMSLCTEAFLQAQDDTRGLWVWTITSDVIDDYFSDNGTRREELLSFIAAPHGDTSQKITRLYMSSYSYMLYKPKKMRRFLADMNYRGIEVFVVISDPRFALPDKEKPGQYPNYNFDKAYNAKFQAHLFDNDTKNGIIPFLERGDFAHEKFAGIMLDIEPHLLGVGNFAEVPYKWDLDDSKQEFPVVWHTYIDNLKFCRQQVDDYNSSHSGENLLFSDAIPSFMNDKYYPADNDSSLMDEIMKHVDFYTVMAYKDNDGATADIIPIAQDEVDAAQLASKECIVTLETTKNLNDPDDIPDSTTFWEEGYNHLHDSIQYIKDSFSGNTGFAGISIHSFADNDTPLRGYQHLEPDGPGTAGTPANKAPVITITSPNGFPVDGVDFSSTNGMLIEWDAFLPDMYGYTITLYYAKESELDNESAWQSNQFYSHAFSAPSSENAVVHGSYLWNPPANVKSSVNEISGKRDGLLIIAKITYPSTLLATFDTTDYGLAVNEGDFDWSPPLRATMDTGVFADQNFQDMQIIPDNDGNLHAVFYIYWGARGLYYSMGSNFGETWTTPVQLATIAGGTAIAPKPSFSLNGDHAAVVWREKHPTNVWPTLPLVNLKIRLGSRGSSGLINWQTERTVSLNGVSVIDINFPDVFVDDNGNAHLTWYAFRPAWFTFIEYVKFSYNGSTWLQDTYEIVSLADKSAYVLNTPSIAVSDSVHVIWGKYKCTSPYSMNIEERTKTGTTWSSVRTVSTYGYSADQTFAFDGDQPPYEKPIYFPKIVTMDNVLYVTWQVTTKGPGDPNGHSLPDYSSIYFSKRTLAGSWDTPTLIASQGYTPDISLWDDDNNSLTAPVIQLVYSNNFAVYRLDGSDPQYEGTLNFTESSNNGATWSSVEKFAENADNDGLGIRIPYNNHPGGERGWHIFSYPFIYTTPDGITITCWVNGKVANEKYFKLRNKFVVTEPTAPFVNYHENDNDTFVVSWSIPENNGVAPSGYFLQRIINNDFTNPVVLNGGNPIRQLSYVDNDTSISSENYYRYQLSFGAGVSGRSYWSDGSNPIRIEQDLLIENFENDSINNTKHSGITYFQYGTEYEQMTVKELKLSASERYTNDGGDGNCLKITYVDVANNDSKGAGLAMLFPSVMDFSSYGSLDLAIKFNPENPQYVTRTIKISLSEADSGEGFNIGGPIQIPADGAWHEIHLFFDLTEFSNPAGNPDGNIERVLELDRISSVNINIYGPPSTSFFIDGMRLNKTPFVNITSGGDIYRDFENPTENNGNNGMIKGIVLNPTSPIEIQFGNAQDPWYLLIYSDGYVIDVDGEYALDNDGHKIPVNRDGMVVAEHPEYNIPLKLWTKTFGPPRFSTAAYPAGYPPIEGYFWSGYNFNKAEEPDNQGDIVDFYDNESGTFVEGSLSGQYSFDLDGDGFQQGDNFFTLADPEKEKNLLLSESPAWLFIPYRDNNETTPEADAVVMHDYDDTTWRILASSFIGSSEHKLQLYFSAYIGLKQVMYSLPEHRQIIGEYADFSTRVYIDLVNN